MAPILPPAPPLGKAVYSSCLTAAAPALRAMPALRALRSADCAPCAPEVSMNRSHVLAALGALVLFVPGLAAPPPAALAAERTIVVEFFSNHR